jgi:sortase (surface protein transpeptidase)
MTNRGMADPKGRHARWSVVAALLLALGLLLASCGQEVEVAEEPEPEPTRTVEEEPEPEPTPVPEGEPVRVEVPAIDVDAELVELGLEEDRSMEVPDFGLAGWYTEGPRPGHPGPSVIAAHVDSKAGPDVFYHLQDLEPGDEINVHYDSGDEVTFVVREPPVQTNKDELPGDEIWPVTNDRLLTLITCGGIFDRSIGHYEDNIIVYAAIAENA